MSYVSADPVALVTVCAPPPPFSHVTVVPAATVRVAGLNCRLGVVQTFVAVGVQPPPPPPPPYGDVEPPHAASSTAPTAPSGRVITLDRIEPPRWCVGWRPAYDACLLPLEAPEGWSWKLSENGEGPRIAV